jgi:hypothetical protein
LIDGGRHVWQGTGHQPGDDGARGHFPVVDTAGGWRNVLADGQSFLKDA